MTAGRPPVDPRAWADQFSMFACSTRLSLLLTLRRVGPLPVGELAATADVTVVAASTALRLLRVHGLVRSERDGRLVRYELTDHAALVLLDQVDRGRISYRE